MEDESNQNSIDTAISVCNDKINVHRALANRFLFIVIALSLLFIGSQGMKVFYETQRASDIRFFYEKLQNDLQNVKNLYGYNLLDSLNPKQDTLDQIKTLVLLQRDLTINSMNKLKETLNSKSSYGFDDFILYGIFILIFSIVTSFYRFHQKEVSKYEHYLIGFHRIGIAANNSPKKFEDQVRTALTREAFTYETSKGLFSKEKKIESPIPGHPTSDLATIMINRIFDAIEIKERKTKKDGE